MTIHTRKNVSWELVKNNCEVGNFENKQNNCVLLTTGSFNPIHRSHINNLKIVKAYLEKHPERPMNVLAAFLSPSHDTYVRTKLGALHFIPATKRSELCQKVICDEKLESWLSVAKGEYDWDGGFLDFDQVSLDLARFLNETLYESEKVLKHPLKVVYVCGLDHFNKCRYVEDLLREKELSFAVIYRLGADEREIQRLAQRSTGGYYIPLTEERSTMFDISSTGIRQQQTNDSNNLEQLTYPSVCSYLKEKYAAK